MELKLSKEKLTEPLENFSLMCRICNCICLNLVICNDCNNSFCKNCIDNYLEINRKCLCNNSRSSFIKIKKETEQQIKNLKFKCLNSNEGCNQIRSFETFVEHDKYCVYRKVKCKNNLCNIELLEKKIKEHEINCHFNSENCIYCFLTILSCERNEHFKKCLKIEKECPGCHFKFSQNNFENHIKECNLINCYCDNCLKYFSKEKKIQHTEQECLKNQLLNYQKEFNQTLKSLVQQIRFTLNEINNKDQNKNIFVKNVANLLVKVN